MVDPKHSRFRAAARVSCMVSMLAAGCAEKAEPQPESEVALSPATASPNPPAPGAPAAGAPNPAAPSPASPAQIAELSKPSGGESGGMYTVRDGTKVDGNTLMGWKTWRALACDRCHGAEQQGLVGPPLVISLHRLTKDEFKKALTDGRPEKGMPPFSASVMVMQNLENLYAYLKGRADAQIQPGHLYPLDSP